MFSARMNNERSKWELGGNKTADDILSEALTLYNNAVSTNRWNISDPKDAKIMALTTKVEELLAGRNTGSAAFVSNGQSQSQPSRFISIDAWRMVKKGASMEREGKTWYWCPRHVVQGKYDGLYVTHKPEDHDEWQKKKDIQNAKKKASKVNSKDNDVQPKQQDSIKNLTLNDNLKAALLTHSEMTGAQVEALLADMGEHSDF